MSLRLSVCEIRSFHDDLPHAVSGRIQAVKAWLREVRRPLVFAVTRQPGEALYMLCEGGNTRLRALQELYDETGDEVFKWSLAHYVPWRDAPSERAARLAEYSLSRTPRTRPCRPARARSNRNAI